MLTALPIISLLLSTVVISNSSSTVVETNVKAEAAGESATTETEVRTVIDGKETKFESDKPGEYRIEVNNEEVKISSFPVLTPTNFQQTEQVKETPRLRIQNLFQRFFRFLRFKLDNL